MTRSPFLLTTYIYPLSGEITLSKELGVSLDNPRTSDEIGEVAKVLKLSLEHPEQRIFTLRRSEESMSIEEVLQRFGEAAGTDDEVVRAYYRGFNLERLYIFLAGMWIIARYDDEGSGAEMEAERSATPRDSGLYFTLLQDEHPVVRNATRLVNYASLLSLLSNTLGEDYNGTSFMFDRGYVSRPRRDAHALMFTRDFVWFSIHALRWSGPASIREYSSTWSVFPHAIPLLEAAAGKFEPLLSGADKEKLLYVGSMLSLGSPDAVRDDKTRLLLLVSILEVLLTHSPDYQRFNVEESISKQFQLKTGLLVYLSDRSRDLSHLRKRLRLIYTMRSNVAHGNFAEIHKYISKLSRKEGEEEYFGDLISDLYVYIRAVVDAYATDPDLVRFLKES